MNKVILVGEIKIGDGCIHQSDFAQALGAERLTGFPKQGTVTVVVGKPLRGKKPAILAQAEKKELSITTVEDVMNDDVRTKLRAILAQKPKLETYEQKAFDMLSAPEAKPARKADTQALAEVFPMPKRGKKKSKKTA